MLTSVLFYLYITPFIQGVKACCGYLVYDTYSYRNVIRAIQPYAC